MSSYDDRSSRTALHAVCSAAVLLVMTACTAIAGPSGVTGTVDGRIVRSDGPVYDVQVYDQQTWKVVTTRSGERFHFDDLRPGDHVFRITSDFCDVQLIPLTIRAGQSSSLDVELTCRPRPCPKPDRGDSTCILQNPEQRRRVGARCEVHHGTKLALDLVPIHYGIAGTAPYDPRKYPNARPWFDAGCVNSGQQWAEVAYCWNCRAAWQLERVGSRLNPTQRNH